MRLLAFMMLTGCAQTVPHSFGVTMVEETT
jgi:hypothetical protein